MNCQHFSAAELLTIDPSIRCFDCGTRLHDSPDHEIWTRLKTTYYCPQCSAAEEIEASPDEQAAMDQTQSIRNRSW